MKSTIEIRQLQTKKTLELCLLRIEKVNLDFTCISWWNLANVFIVSQWYFNALSKTFEEIDKAYI